MAGSSGISPRPDRGAAADRGSDPAGLVRDGGEEFRRQQDVPERQAEIVMSAR